MLGILCRCEEWLTEPSILINKEFVDDEKSFERCMEDFAFLSVV